MHILPRAANSFSGAEHLQHATGNCGCQEGRDRIADLTCNFGLGSTEDKSVRKGLQPRGFAVGYRTMLLRMKVASFLRFEEFRSNRKCRTIPPESTEQVRAPLCFAYPARGRDLRRTLLEIKTVHSFLRDG